MRKSDRSKLAATVQLAIVGSLSLAVSACAPLACRLGIGRCAGEPSRSQLAPPVPSSDAAGTAPTVLVASSSSPGPPPPGPPQQQAVTPSAAAPVPSAAFTSIATHSRPGSYSRGKAPQRQDRRRTSARPATNTVPKTIAAAKPLPANVIPRTTAPAKPSRAKPDLAKPSATSPKLRLIARAALSAACRSDAPPVLTLIPNQGPGFVTYPAGGHERQYATVCTARLLQEAASKWATTGRAPVAFGNISLKNGGWFAPPHCAHRNGNDVDIRPQRRDRANAPVSYLESNYDRDATRQMVRQLIASTGASILFNDPILIQERLVRPYRGHDDHLHVSIPRTANVVPVGPKPKAC